MSTQPDTHGQALLVALLKAIKKADEEQNYSQRNIAIHSLLSVAMNLGFKAGIRIDPQEPDWPVAFVELPQGQVSWHLPQHEQAWDGHTTDEKYQRIAAYLKDATS